MSEYVRTACSACRRIEGHQIEDNEIVPDDWFCRPCMARYPSVLLLASVAGSRERFALGLRNGVEIRFCGAELVQDGRFVRVYMTKTYGSDPENPDYTALPIESGEIDVNLDEIAWVCEVRS